MDQLAAFRQSLAETIAWCAARATVADPEGCLRTPDLKSVSLDDARSLGERQACVATVIEARSRLLREAGLYPSKPATDLAGGRLLLFDPDETLSDGAAAVGSRRFFDDDNVPPWACWVLYVADPLTPEQQQAQGQRTGRWSHVAPTPEAGTLGGPPYYFVGAHQSYLVSWVAPALIPLAHNGVVVNPENCIEWLVDRDTPFTHALQELHLLV